MTAPSNTSDAHAAVLRAKAACEETARVLREAAIAPEALAKYVPESRVLILFRRAATMQKLGEVWRLGSLLLHTDGSLSQLGKATRSLERGRVGYQSLSREDRRDIAAAALHGGYPEGTPVNYDAAPIDLTASAVIAESDTSPIGFADGEVRVRWRAGASLSGAATLPAFLAERSELLIHPPFSPPHGVSNL